MLNGMSSATALPPRAAYTTEPVYRFSVDQWHDLIGRGKLTDDDPVELIEGVPVFKMPKNEPHVAAGRRLRRAVEAVLPPTHFYDAEQPITLADGEPEPDGVVVRGAIEDYDTAKVRPADMALVAEISDTTLDRDRTMKYRTYARAAVACYCIVNLVDRQIEVYTDPDSVAAVPVYRGAAVYRPGDAVPVLADGHLVGVVRVDEVLPRPA